jgi:aryl-alcohol dehydrogenase-like predicted oxidoreductase
MAPGTRVAFGTMGLTPIYNSDADFSEAERALRLGLDLGIRVFHTAQHYGDGRALELLGRTLAGRGPGDVEIVAKIDVHPDRLLPGPEGIDSTCSQLGREHLDTAQLVGWSPWADQPIPVTEILDDLEAGGRIAEQVGRLRDQGRIGRIAVEVFTPEEAARAATLPEVAMVVCDQSLIRQTLPPEKAGEAFRSGRVEVMAIRPLAGGWLTERYERLEDFAAGDRRRDWYAAAEPYRRRIAEALAGTGIGVQEAALRFLHQEAFPQAIAVGMRTVSQVEAALRPECARPLPEEIYQKLLSLFDQPVVIEED